MKRGTRFLLSAAILAVCACLVWRAYHREPLAVFGGGREDGAVTVTALIEDWIKE